MANQLNRTPDLKSAERHAKELLASYGLAEPPVNPMEICKALGIKVRFATFIDEHAEISGFYDCSDNSIFVNADEHPLRQTFTIAHELGHSLMHRDWAESNDYVVLMMRSDGINDNNPYELEADAFALHLLAPRVMLDKYQDLSKTDLSRLFAMTVPAIDKRLKHEYGI